MWMVIRLQKTNGWEYEKTGTVPGMRFALTHWRMTQSDANQSLSELAQLMIFTATWLTLWGG
jgi:hypothetical protein